MGSEFDKIAQILVVITLIYQIYVEILQFVNDVFHLFVELTDIFNVIRT